MPLKKSVNDSLSRLTGYQVTRAQGTGSSLSARQVKSLSTSSRDLAETNKALSATVRELKAALTTARADADQATPAPIATPAVTPAEAGAGAGAATFPSDFDDDFRAIIRAVRPYTMIGDEKLHALISATKYVSRYNVPGGIVEFGVWRGGGMKAVALTLEAADDHTRDLYLYDTFDAIAAENTGSTAAPQVGSREDVDERFASGPYPREKIHLVIGSAEQIIPDQLPEQISILRVDTGWLESSDDAFKHAYDRLVSGGVLMIDEYGWWQGSRAATDEFLERTGDRLLLLRMGSGRVAIKP